LFEKLCLNDESVRRRRNEIGVWLALVVRIVNAIAIAFSGSIVSAVRCTGNGEDAAQSRSAFFLTLRGATTTTSGFIRRVHA